jgi:hypothetical protein
VTKCVRWRTPHEWWDEKDQEWVVGGGIRPKPGDILEYEMRHTDELARKIDEHIVRIADETGIDSVRIRLARQGLEEDALLRGESEMRRERH